MSKVMQLAKNMDLKRISYPVVVTEKLDGVPADFSALDNGEIIVRTRQNEDIRSVQHIKDWLYGILKPHHHVIGELTAEGVVFKEVSGLVRGYTQAPQLVLNVFDYYVKGQELDTYQQRMELMSKDVGNYAYDDNLEGCVRTIPGVWCEKQEALLYAISKLRKHAPESEGAIIRSLTGKDSGYQIGKRSWGFQRVKAIETVDLVVTSFEEACSASGVPLGMVGRIVCKYKDTFIGVGPGNLTHAERKAIWFNQKDYLFGIAEVSYKPDTSYDALREPIFKRWRDDKQESNIE